MKMKIDKQIGQETAIFFPHPPIQMQRFCDNMQKHGCKVGKNPSGAEGQGQNWECEGCKNGHRQWRE